MAEARVSQDVIETLGGLHVGDVGQDVIEYLFSDVFPPGSVFVSQDVIEYFWQMEEEMIPFPTVACMFGSSFQPGVRLGQGVCQ